MDKDRVQSLVCLAFSQGNLVDLFLRGGKHIVKISLGHYDVVVKKFDFSYQPVFGRDPLIAIKELYEHEVAILQALSGYNQQYLHHFEEHSCGYLILKYCNGIAVHQYLKQYPQDAKVIVTQCLQAVESLHDFGFLHGDLQPDHFLVDHKRRVQLIDFGLSGRLPYGYAHYPSQLVYFASPEVCRYMLDPHDSFHYSQASEWYSFGATMVFALTGKLATTFPKGISNTPFAEKTARIATMGTDRYFTELHLEISPYINDRLRKLLIREL